MVAGELVVGDWLVDDWLLVNWWLADGWLVGWSWPCCYYLQRVSIVFAYDVLLTHERRRAALASERVRVRVCCCDSSPPDGASPLLV